MTVNVAFLNPDELAVYQKIVKPGRTRLLSNTAHSMNMTLAELNAILRRFDKRIETVPRYDGYSEYYVRDIIKHRPQGLLPCMVSEADIRECPHYRECYLSVKCKAAQRLLQGRKCHEQN